MAKGISDGGISTAKLAAKAVTRDKLADAVFPLFSTAEVSAKYTIAAGSTQNVLVGEIPAKPGYTYVGCCAFNSGDLSCCVAGVSGRYMMVKNTYTQALSPTAKLTFLYVRS